MYWLLLPLAALMLLLALRTPSPGVMALWFCLMLATLAMWTWLRYRRLFPVRETRAELTPLDPAELSRLRQQMQANREADAAAHAAADAEALHPIHPIAHPMPGHAEAAHPVEVVTVVEVERPLTGRAVFVVPDKPSSVIIPGDRAT